MEKLISNASGISLSQSRRIVKSCIAQTAKELKISITEVQSIVENPKFIPWIVNPNLKAKDLNMEIVKTQGKLLGKGNTASVYLYNGYAIKIGDIASPYEASIVKNEVRIMETLSKWPNCHEYIVCLHDYHISQFRPGKVNSYSIIMYPIDGVSMDRYYTKALRHNEASDLIARCLKGLHYIHSHNIYHNDIHEGNIMISHDGTIKYIDFGMACSAPCKHGGGFPDSEPPEMDDLILEYPRQYDIWGLGISLFRTIHNIKNTSLCNSDVIMEDMIDEDMAEPLIDEEIRGSWKWKSHNDSFSYNVKDRFALNQGKLWKGVYHVLDRMLMIDPANRAITDELIVHDSR